MSRMVQIKATSKLIAQQMGINSDDVEIVDIVRDKYNPLMFNVFVSSPQFETVPEGGGIPVVVPTFESTGINWNLKEAQY